MCQRFRLLFSVPKWLVFAHCSLAKTSSKCGELFMSERVTGWIVTPKPSDFIPITGKKWYWKPIEISGGKEMIDDNIGTYWILECNFFAFCANLPCSICRPELQNRRLVLCERTAETWDVYFWKQFCSARQISRLYGNRDTKIVLSWREEDAIHLLRRRQQQQQLCR